MTARILRTLGWLAFAKLSTVPLILLAYIGRVGRPDGLTSLMVVFATTYAVSGAVLMRRGRGDARARLLGCAFLLCATAFADPIVSALDAFSLPLGDALRWAFALHLDGLAPPLLVAFALRYPRTGGASHDSRIGTWFVRGATMAGLFLVAVNLLGHLAPASWPSALRRFLLVWSRHDANGPYWPFQFAFMLAAMATLVFRLPRADSEERQRASALLWGLVLGAAPIVIYVVVRGLWPSINDTLPPRRVAWLVYLALISIPVVTAWAIVARGALDVSLIIGRAVRYLLARGVLTIVAVSPLVGLLVIAVLHQDESVSALAVRWDIRMLAFAALLGLLLLQGRLGLIARLDRRFFNEQPDVVRTFGALAMRGHRADDADELAKAVREEIDDALHVEHAALLIRGPTGTLDAPDESVASLPARSRLLGDGLIDDVVQWSQADATDTLSPDEHAWLTKHGVRLVLPLRDPVGATVGAIVIGRKRSELPYSQRDLNVLRAVAQMTQASLLLFEARAGRTSIDTINLAQECVVCGALAEHSAVECPDCGCAVQFAAVPKRLNTKFTIKRRLGAGAMGVVYLATDDALGRAVAIKTLPRVSDERVASLLREARAVASVSHPNLAMILSAESWRNQPMLVFELLDGGTLAHRLASGPLIPSAALDLTIALADALVVLHDSGVLHRDIKPSNIGFASDGTVKLLDFGLAQLLREPPEVRTERTGTTTYGDADGERSLMSSRSLIVGTPAYMSPEARRGNIADESFDTWSLCVVLAESIFGMRVDTRAYARHGAAWPRDAHVTEALMQFFADAFDADIARRPRTSRALFARLIDVRNAS